MQRTRSICNQVLRVLSYHPLSVEIGLDNFVCGIVIYMHRHDVSFVIDTAYEAPGM